MNGVHTWNESGFMKEGILHCGGCALKNSGDRFCFASCGILHKKKFVYFSCLGCDIYICFACALEV